MAAIKDKRVTIFFSNDRSTKTTTHSKEYEHTQNTSKAITLERTLGHNCIRWIPYENNTSRKKGLGGSLKQ